MIYYAVSIKMPWPYAILFFGKDGENRTWDLPRKFYGATVLIHAGRNFDNDGCRWLIAQGYSLPGCHRDNFLWGGIVGALTFGKQVTPAPRSPWAEPGLRWWPIASSWPVEFFPCKGSLGFFKVDYPYEVQKHDQ